MHKSGSFVSWGGHRIHVVETGQGEPLLLVGGLGGNTEMWAPFLAELSNRRVIRFDAPGSGLSSTPMFPVPVAALAHLATTILDARGVPSADVIGFSYGGAVAQQLAYEYPARVRRLVLAATTCGLGGAIGSIDALMVLTTPIRYYSPRYFERTAAACFGGVTARDQVVRRQMMTRRRHHPPSAYGYSMQILGAIGWSSLPFLSRIPHKTLVVSGDDDPLIPVQNAKLLAAQIPNARLDIVPSAGHLLLWDDPQTLGQRISRFVNAAPDASPSTS